MAHLPSLQTLRALEAAARLRSYSKAAQELGLTHGAVSHRIRELEEQLGYALFARTGNTMVPTNECQQLVSKVRQGLSLLEQAFAPAPAQSSLKNRNVVVTSVPSIAYTWLYKRISEFRDEQPEIDIDLRVSERLSDYKKEKIDLGIRLGLGGWSDLNAVKLFDEALTPVCSPKYRDQLALMSPQDLSRATLLRNPWTPWVRWFNAVGLDWPEPTKGPLYSDSTLLLRAALEGQGVALGRHWLALDAVRSGFLVMPFDTSARDDFQYWLAWPAGRTAANPNAVLFREWLAARAAAEDHPCPLGQPASGMGLG